MFIVLDETGDFKDPKSKRFGLVTLVTITDSELRKFDSFMLSIFPKGYGEIKGRMLSESEREKVLKYISSKPEIKYTSLVYDISFGGDDSVKIHAEKSLTKLEAAIGGLKNLSPKGKQQFELLRNQLRKYKIGDYAKFVIYTEVFIAWQQYFHFDYIYTHLKRDSWELHFILDSQNEPSKFQDLLKKMLGLTTNELNPNYSIYTPNEWDKSHPLVQRYSEKGDVNRINGKDFYQDLIVGDEKTYPSLFLPDVIGYTIYNSILNCHNVRGLKFLKRLRPNRSMTLTHGGKNGYYTVGGFGGVILAPDMNEILREHYTLMSKI